MTSATNPVCIEFRAEELAEILNGVFANTSATNPYWYGKASILRSVLFRKRMGLEFDKKYLCDSDSLCLHHINICKSFVEKHPDKTAKEIAIKFCDHAMQNDSLWSRSVGIPTLYAKLTGRKLPAQPVRQNRAANIVNNYTLSNVKAEDVAYGSCSYTERRYYHEHEVDIPEDVMQQAVDNDNADIIFDWLEEAMGESDPSDYGDLEYGDCDQDGSEDFCLTDRDNLREQINLLMGQYEADNPRDED